MAIFKPSTLTAFDEALEVARRAIGKPGFDEALAKAEAISKGGAGARSAEAAAPRGASLLAKGFQTEIKSLEEMLSHPSAIKDPAGAAKIWDQTYREIAQNAKLNGLPIGPNGKTVTYRMPDGSMKTLGITEPPPMNAQRISLTDVELREMMPPRPVPPAEATPRPAHGYEQPRPAGMEPPTGAAASPTEEAVRVAQQATAGSKGGPWYNPPTPGMSRPPSVGARASVEAGRPGPDMAQILGRYGLPAAGAATGAYMMQPKPNYDAMTSEEMVNPPATLGYGYSGSTVSPDESDFAPSGSAFYHRQGPLADRINPDMEKVYQRQGPLADRTSTVQAALTAARTAAPSASSIAPAEARPSAASSSSEPSALARIIRGRFGEAANEDPNKLTAFQEARDRAGGMATGGSIEAKPPKDAALHKALEIIHHLIRRG